MTKDQKALLTKHADHFSAMASYVRESSSEDLDELRDACRAATETNCGWDTFEAARWIEREIRREIVYRRRLAETNSIKAQ